MIRNYTLLLLISISLQGFTQDAVGINNDSPDASAILDVTSTDKGLLIPRMSSAQRTGISRPAAGLLVYDNTSNTFWFFNGSAWSELVTSATLDELTDTDADKKIQVEKSADEDIIRFDMNEVEHFRMVEGGRIDVVNTGNSVFIGEGAGTNDDLSVNNNVFVGSGSGNQNTTGVGNTAVGYQSLNSNITGVNNVGIGSSASFGNKSGSSNIAIGSNALLASDSASHNIAIGDNTLREMSTGTRNIAIGSDALSTHTGGKFNVAIGNESLKDNIKGDRNTAIGHLAGSAAPGSGNIFIGYSAGFNEDGDNKLYIESSNSTEPLIWGDFAADSLVVNGDLHVTDDITYVGTITDISDYRLKENFDTLDRVITLLQGLQAYSYNMKGGDLEEREYGLVAQEVQKEFPLVVKEVFSKKKYLGVSYTQLIPIVLVGVKEQQNDINKLDSELRVLEKELDELSKEFSLLKYKMELNLN